MELPGLLWNYRDFYGTTGTFTILPGLLWNYRDFYGTNGTSMELPGLLRNYREFYGTIGWDIYRINGNFYGNTEMKIK